MHTLPNFICRTFFDVKFIIFILFPTWYHHKHKQWESAYFPICIVYKEHGLCDLTPCFLNFSHQVLSIEKAENTSLLPNPVIVSIRTKKAFQLIELHDRDELVESLNSRLRSLQWKQSMFRSKKDGKRSMVRVMFGFLNFIDLIFLLLMLLKRILTHWQRRNLTVGGPLIQRGLINYIT